MKNFYTCVLYECSNGEHGWQHLSKSLLCSGISRLSWHLGSNYWWILSCEQELWNRVDRYAVAVKKNRTVIGHIPRKMSRVCLLFLRKREYLVYWTANNDTPSCRIARLYVYISMKRNPTRSMFVYGNLIYIELTKASMCEWYSKVMQRYAESCNATQGHATSCKIMSSCKASHTPA